MHLIILKEESCSPLEFVEFWERLYEEGKYPDSIYEKNLNKSGRLSDENIEPLLEWKNGGPLSKAKKNIANKIKENLHKFNDFRGLKTVSQDDFNEFWGLTSNIIKTGIVWRVYLVHIARPDDYPILDQHVLRAYHYLTRGEIAEPPQTLDTYNEYRKLFNKIVKETGKEPRMVDRALMAFGQYLASQFSKTISNHDSSLEAFKRPF